MGLAGRKDELSDINQLIVFVAWLLLMYSQGESVIKPVLPNVKLTSNRSFK
jgi:hypothetical protein